MQVIFIHQSCFLLEIDDIVLIFDYFSGDRVRGFSFKGKIPTYEEHTKIYVFASHNHADHYDSCVLEWAKQYPNIKYIFAKDIPIGRRFLRDAGISKDIRQRVETITADHRCEVDDLKIQTFGDGNSGVAFYVELRGVSLFYAGGLSDSRMEGAGDLINGRIKRAYRHEIKRLKGLPINLAFIPMDPNLGEYQSCGIQYFAENTDAEYIFPMQMWQDYSGIDSFCRTISNRAMAERIMKIERENQLFFFQES